MFPEVRRILVTEEELAEAVERLAEQLLDEYRDRDLVMVAALNGSVVFLSDLIRKLPLRLSYDVIAAGSYGSGTASSGSVTIRKGVTVDIRGRDVLLIDDIFDTGLTLSVLLDHLRQYEPRSLKSCVLLYKKKPSRQCEIEPDFHCLETEDEFVVGYGLDYDSRYRNLPYLGVLDQASLSDAPL